MGEDAYPTELAGVAELHTESIQAWALDYDDYEPTQRLTPRRITSTALSGSLVLIAAAGVVALLAIRGVLHITPAPGPVVVAAPSSPTPVATPTTTAWARPAATDHPRITPTKPPTVTVQAPPRTIQAAAPTPTAITAEQVAAYDKQFIANLLARGWRVWDSLAITQQAHEMCAALERGETPQWAVQRTIGPTTPPADAQQFVDTAMLTYPACP